MEHYVGFYIKRIAQRLESWQNQRVEQHGATLSQMRLLSLLWAKDGQSQKDLQEELDIAPSSITGLTDLLEERGLVSRRGDCEDGRVNRIWLTATGRAMEQQSRSDLDELEATLTSGFSPEEKALLLGALRRLKANMTR